MVSLIGVFTYFMSFKMNLPNADSQTKAAKSWFEILFSVLKYQINAQLKFVE